MENYLFYIGKSALATGAFYLAYLVLFQNQKHFMFNRFYLPVSLALSFLIPLITFTTVKIVEPVSFNSNSFAYIANSTEIVQPIGFVFQWYHYLFGLYILGSCGFLFHLLLGHLKAISIVKRSWIKNLFQVKVNVTNKDIHPFSFFNKIVLSEKTLSHPNLEIIVSHENIHVKEKHTLDILFAELLFLAQWFNPFAWLIKDAIKNNLEYKTDHQIAENHNPQAYQLAMVGLADKKGVAPFLTALNGSQLKNRIIMMKKKTESKYAVLKQLVVLPLLAILVMGLSSREVRTEIIQPENKIELSQFDNDFLKMTDKEFLSKIYHDGIFTLQDYGEDAPLLFFNGEEVIEKIVFNETDLKFGKSIKPNQAVELYGERGKNGVLTFNTEIDSEEYKLLMKRIENKEKIIVKGKVTDPKDDPISGASIIVKGKTIGTITDANGNYELRLDNENETLVFIMVGFEKLEIPVDNKNEINIKLNSDKSVSVGTKSVTINTKYKHVVKGKVTDQNSDPISGASILIKGKTIGTITDRMGNYEIKLEEKNETLIFWMIDYKMEEILVAGQSEIDVELVPNEKAKSHDILISTYKSKQTGKKSQGDEVFYKVEEMPQFPGGEKALKKYIDYSIKYPEIALEKGIHGKVYVTFIIDKNGKVNDPKISRGVDPSLNKEALRVVNTLPKWKPGKQNGKIVNVSYTVPINFVPTVKQIRKYSKLGLEIESLEKRNENNKNATKIAVGYPSSNMEFDSEVVRISPNMKNPPLYIVDGKEVEDITYLPPENIESIDVLKDKSATDLYGEKGKNGVICIETKFKKDFNTSDKLIIVDGKEFDGNINDVTVEDIASIDVLKNKTATELYGEKGKNGVIYITTKKKALNKKTVELESFLISIEVHQNKIKLRGLSGCAFKELTFSIKNNNPVVIDKKGISSSEIDQTLSGFLFEIEKVNDQIKLNGKSGTAWKNLSFKPADKRHIISEKGVSLSTLDDDKPLIITDGIITGYKSMDDIDPETIQSISVLKKESAISKYGEKGKNGVILVTTKNSVKFTSKNLPGNPALIVDGKEFYGNINDIPVTDIISMEVKKNQTDTNIYDGKGPEIDKIIIQTKTKYNTENKKPLIVTDGIITGYKSMDDIDPETIQSVSVLKDESAISKYGDRGKNGVIEISIKGVHAAQITLPVILNGKSTEFNLHTLDRDLIKDINKVEPKEAVKKYGELGKYGVYEVSSRKLYTDKVKVKSTSENDKIDTELKFRKFIAKEIRYPVLAQEANREKVVKLSVQIDKKGNITSINEKDGYIKIRVGEVVVAGNKTKEVVVNGYGTKAEAENARKIEEQLMVDETRRVINKMPIIDITEFKGKTVGITVKFVLQ
ncbi:MAG: TonB family protein [Prolixibacteraceae bacterium]|jgi:TonB family protein|nr:TonB family protein [Prolixibacteraceae bacterium]MBT6998980.1 TonB family protein [Prolixibacteraceae bacterium]